MAGKQGKAIVGNCLNGNQFRDDEISILDQLRDGKTVKNIFPKIGGRLRLAHEENDQLSIMEIIKYDENLAVVKAVTSTMKGVSLGAGMETAGKVPATKRRGGNSGLSITGRVA